MSNFAFSVWGITLAPRSIVRLIGVVIGAIAAIPVHTPFDMAATVPNWSISHDSTDDCPGGKRGERKPHSIVLTIAAVALVITAVAIIVGCVATTVEAVAADIVVVTPTVLHVLEILGRHTDVRLLRGDESVYRTERRCEHDSGKRQRCYP